VLKIVLVEEFQCHRVEISLKRTLGIALLTKKCIDEQIEEFLYLGTALLDSFYQSKECMYDGFCFVCKLGVVDVFVSFLA